MIKHLCDCHVHLHPARIEADKSEVETILSKIVSTLLNIRRNLVNHGYNLERILGIITPPCADYAYRIFQTEVRRDIVLAGYVFAHWDWKKDFSKFASLIERRVIKAIKIHHFISPVLVPDIVNDIINLSSKMGVSLILIHTNSISPGFIEIIKDWADSGMVIILFHAYWLFSPYQQSSIKGLYGEETWESFLELALRRNVYIGTSPKEHTYWTPDPDLSRAYGALGDNLIFGSDFSQICLAWPGGPIREYLSRIERVEKSIGFNERIMYRNFIDILKRIK